jgi:hypothetical protein
MFMRAKDNSGLGELDPPNPHDPLTSKQQRSATSSIVQASSLLKACLAPAIVHRPCHRTWLSQTWLLFVHDEIGSVVRHSPWQPVPLLDKQATIVSTRRPWQQSLSR